MLDYHHLSEFGSCYPLNLKLSKPHDKVSEVEKNFDFVRYNPRKDIDRWGLSLTSLDGGMSGIPDLDSLREYNRENNTSYEEMDFNVPTPAYDIFKEVLDPYKEWLTRTHILKLNPSGYFPPHRDSHTLKFFRLIVPLMNTSPPSFTFVLEDKILNLELGRVHFMQTIKMHYLFNMSVTPSYWLVMNINCTKESVTKVIRNLKYS